MAKRMLIDATHTEETRVAIVSGNRLEDYDFENTVRKSYKGNVYLAKVTRVEPSLQAAFVDYGGNRHGFLPFSEIHPDYYRIPIADREALLQRKKEASEKIIAREEEAADEAETETEEEETEEGEVGPSEEDSEENPDSEEGEETEDILEEEAGVHTVGGEDAEEEEEDHPAPQYLNILKEYKIQEVIKRGQVMLVQVTKEERGTKGAALTSYISLPGRYCVLMPNSPHGGGVSRKVANSKDRQKLRKILSSLDIADGMAVIIRTAGMSRTKAEIKRDYEYLMRTWGNIRELTLKSTAPTEVYEEGNLIKRSIRDLYTSDIDEIVVAGDDGYRAAKDFMKTLVPSHAKRVQPYKDEEIPLFFRYQVESHIEEIYNSTVQLDSGGYIVINPTEALISIDVNSGRATKERHIEETALKTNMEAAVEIARQLRLRDLGGLIVIDFIDMEERRNNRTVERALREAMDQDRARVQIGRISPFGLLEMSRQRLRPSLMETHFETCSACKGRGVVRTRETAALRVLRLIEEEGIRKRSSELTVEVPSAIALFILNQKRDHLADIERRYDFRVNLKETDSPSITDITIERTDIKSGAKTREEIKSPDEEAQKHRGEKDDRLKRRQRSEKSSGRGEEDSKPQGDDTGEKSRRRRGRRGGRRRRNNNRQDNQNQDNQRQDNQGQARPENQVQETAPESQEDFGLNEKSESGTVNPSGEATRKRGSRRRGRRGGRNRSKRDGNNTSGDSSGDLARVDVVALPSSSSGPGAAESSPNDNAPKDSGPDNNNKPRRAGWWQRLRDS